MSKFPKDMRVGDTLEVVIRSKVTNLSRPDLVYLKNNFFTVDQDDVVSVRIIPRPIEVGDVVRSKAVSTLGGMRHQAYSRYLTKGEVLAIDEGSQEAWVSPILYNGDTVSPPRKNATYNLAELERCDGR